MAQRTAFAGLHKVGTYLDEDLPKLNENTDILDGLLKQGHAERAAEAVARLEGDSVLGARMDLEAQAREAVQASMAWELATEAAARGQADDDLQQAHAALAGTVTALEAAVVQAMPVGAVLPFAMAAAPEGWLRCNGAAISRTAYAALFAVIGATFGAGDGETTFHLPDLRGEFLRGWDDSRGADAGRVLGTAQAGMVGPHSHILDYTLGATTGVTANVPAGPGSAVAYATRATTTSETRPRNVALLFCVKY
ncbi:tail fiber protein [Megalodesulfovibrio paquesii]